MPRDHGINPLAPFFVWKADDRGLDHAFAREQHILHLAWVHVVATGDQHVVLAINEVKKAVMIHVADIAGVQPAIAERLRGRLWPIPVMGHRLWPATDDFAMLARRQRSILFVENGDFCNGEGTPARTYAVVVFRPQAGDDHGAFGLSIGLHQDAAEAVFCTL